MESQIEQQKFTTKWIEEKQSLASTEIERNILRLIKNNTVMRDEITLDEDGLLASLISFHTS